MPDVAVDHELALSGCTPEPLMNYLKALGVFRLVAEQADPAATLSWRGGATQLRSQLDRDGLIEFFVERYRPTPIVAPWNGGSGFYGGGSEPLSAIADSDADRLQVYRETIERIRQFVPKSKPKDDDKESLLIRCRSELPDEIVPWLDVCFVLGEERINFFPLLGTGGNDGRLDFTNNFMQRLAEVVSLTARDSADPQSTKLLSASLFADTIVSLGKSAIGQFHPGGIGGANGTQGRFEANSRVNPWDFVLMIEGALLFAGSAARRMGPRTSLRAVFPFSVDSVAVGYASATASEETTDGSRAELWLPLWNTPCTLAELKHLFAEGRAQIGRRQARNAVEFALAVNLLGVNRGVSSFARFGFLKRNGLAFLATPLGRIEVVSRPKARLLDDPALTKWLDRWRKACRDKDKTPARYQAALRQIDRAMFAFANRSEQSNEHSDARNLLNVLGALGNAERTLAGGLRFATDNHLRPLHGLSSQWLERANDGSPEFRLAAAVAGIQSQGEAVGPFRAFLEEVEVTNFVKWSPGSTSTVWSNGSLEDNLAAVFRRRQLEAFRAGLGGMPLQSRSYVPLADVLAFLCPGEINDDKLAALIWGLSTVAGKAPPPANQENYQGALPFEFGALRLLTNRYLVLPRRTSSGRLRWQLETFNENHQGESWGAFNRRSTQAHIEPEPAAFDRLTTSRNDAVQSAMEIALRRFKSGGRPAFGHRNRQQSTKSIVGLSKPVAPQRLLAAMLFPLNHRDLQWIANRVLYPPESEE